MSATQTCPVCRVAIANDTVHFSNGNPGTRSRLYARVCQYATQKGCINQDPEKIGTISPQDRFLVPGPLKFNPVDPVPLGNRSPQN